MSIVPIFHGHVSKGRLIYDEPERYLVWMARLEGKAVETTVRKRRSQRSNNQNRFYWGVVVEILANEFGYTKEELHEALKYRFLSTHAEDNRGLVKIGSTAALSTDGFVKYINEVVRWAGEQGVFIPDPGQVDF